MNAKDLLKSSDKVKSLFVTALGSNKESLFRKEIFDGMTEKQIPSYRSKLRKRVRTYFEAFIFHKDNVENLKVLFSEFDKFYKATYKLNDYSFASLASENTKDSNKQIIKDGLQVINDFLKKEQKKQKEQKKDKK